MYLTIILDKSTFQSLSYMELYRLSCYYKHIVTPVLTLEILGDLSKEKKEGKAPPENRVIDFAKKLFTNKTIVNQAFKKIVLMDLKGNAIPLDRRPIVDVEKTTSMLNQVGFKVKESKEENAINKWKQGNFSEAEKELSAEWRRTTSEPEILERLRKTLNYKKLNLKSIEELYDYVIGILDDPNNQEKLLIDTFQNYDISAMAGVTIMAKWNQKGKPLLKHFSPYTYHCLTVDLIFLFGLAEQLIGTRSTNAVDLQYLYYLPFCKVFSSNDKIHKQLVPILIKPDQIFIEGPELKADFKSIIAHIESLDEPRKIEFFNKPPINENSITFQIWKDLFGYTENDHLWNREITEEEKQESIEHMEKIMSAIENGGEESLDISDADFLVKTSYIQKDDPCPCGSGKKIIECHMTEKEFNKQEKISFLKDILNGTVKPDDVSDDPPSKDDIRKLIRMIENDEIDVDKIG